MMPTAMPLALPVAVPLGMPTPRIHPAMPTSPHLRTTRGHLSIHPQLVGPRLEWMVK